MRGLHVCVFALLAASIAISGGCARNPATGAMQLRVISLEQEVRLGEEAAPDFEKEFDGKVADAGLQQYVQQVGAKLASASDRQEVQYEYALLASDVPNAFALPGGKIYVTAGLVSKMTSERQLAAVLGHETAHVAALHSVSALQRQMGVSVLASLASEVLTGSAGEAAKIGAEVAGAMVNLKYSRGDEYQADTLGVRYMTKAGHDPQGMVELLTTLYNLNDSEGGSLGEMFATHPLTSKRIDEAKAYIAENYPGRPPAGKDPNAGRFLEMRDRMMHKLGRSK